WETDAVPHEPGGAEAGSRMDQPLRTVLAKSAHAHQSTRRTHVEQVTGGNMATTASPTENLTLDITQEIHVHAPLTETFAALLEEMGPSNLGYNNVPMPMKIEPWPGGRWFRDLGDNNGHFWGHVQAIKQPTLLEITGPL